MSGPGSERHRPRRARPDEITGRRLVRCPHCHTGWDVYSLYKTGDVLRCPDCDGVIRP